MSKLLLIDKSEDGYMLEGELERLRPAGNTFLDEENILLAIEQFKADLVDQGAAVGTLNDGFLVIPTEHGEQVAEDDKEPAFMIVDVYWNRDQKTICGIIMLIENEEGAKVKSAIDRGVECFISSSNTELYTVMDEDSGRMYNRISHIGGYKISLFEFHNTI